MMPRPAPPESGFRDNVWGPAARPAGVTEVGLGQGLHLLLFPCSRPPTVTPDGHVLTLSVWGGVPPAASQGIGSTAGALPGGRRRHSPLGCTCGAARSAAPWCSGPAASPRPGRLVRLHLGVRSCRQVWLGGPAAALGHSDKCRDTVPRKSDLVLQGPQNEDSAWWGAFLRGRPSSPSGVSGPGPPGPQGWGTGPLGPA